MRRVVAVLLIVCVLLISIPVPSHGNAGDGVITRYDVTATTSRDGQTAVSIAYDIDFGTDAQHGPYVTLPLRQTIPGDPDHYRALDVSGISAASSSGAPTAMRTETDADTLLIKVGDPQRKVAGPQNYRLDYTVRGLVAPGSDGPDRISWNVIGTRWDVPLRNVHVSLIGPAAASSAACYAGDPLSGSSCAQAGRVGDRAVFGQSFIAKGQGLTVITDWPAGTFIDAQPRLLPRRNLDNAFAADRGTVGAAILILLLGSVYFLRRVRRSGAAATSGPVAVRFSPPEGVGPGALGTLREGVTQPRQVVATVVDLAVRGRLEVRPVGSDWRLIRTEPAMVADDASPSVLSAAEAEVLTGLFPADGSRDEILLSELRGSFGAIERSTRRSLDAEVTDRGWFSTDPGRLRTRGYLIAAAVLLFGVVLSIGLALAFGWGLPGLAVVAVGVVGLLTAGRMAERTDGGVEALRQSRGFELYLRTAEARQLRYEEGLDVFSRYLPYAIAFGIAGRWAAAFSRLALDDHGGADNLLTLRPGLGSGFGLGPVDDRQAGALTAFAAAASTLSGTGAGAHPIPAGLPGFAGGAHLVGAGMGGGGGGSW